MFRFLIHHVRRGRLHSRNWILLLICALLTILCWKCKEQAINDSGFNASAALDHRLLDLRHFRLQLDSDTCNNDTFLLIVIHSAPNHFGNRNAIRETWGSPGQDVPPVRAVFMLAEPRNETLQSLLEHESEQFGDIVQGNFIDSYRNLTYKHVMGLQWAVNNCRLAKFVMKMDDDIFLDVYQLVNLLRNQFSKLGGRLACYFQHQMPVVRDPASKWFVSKEEYAGDTFDDYCSGWAYVINVPTAKMLIEAASRMPYFWIDDVHITGSVAKKAGVPIVRMNRYFALETDPLVEWIRSEHRMLWNRIFAPTWGDVQIMRKAHLRAKRCHLEKCVCCYSPTTPKPERKETKHPSTGRSLIKRLFV